MSDMSPPVTKTTTERQQTAALEAELIFTGIHPHLAPILAAAEIEPVRACMELDCRCGTCAPHTHIASIQHPDGTFWVYRSASALWGAYFRPDQSLEVHVEAVGVTDEQLVTILRSGPSHAR